MKPRKANPFNEGSFRYDLQEALSDWAAATGEGLKEEFLARRAEDNHRLQVAAIDAKQRRSTEKDPESNHMLGQLVMDAYRRKACDMVLAKVVEVYEKAIKGIRVDGQSFDYKAAGTRVSRMASHEANAQINLIFSEWKEKGEESVEKLFLNRDDAEFVRLVIATESTGNWAGKKDFESILETIKLTEKNGKVKLTMPESVLCDLIETEQLFHLYEGRNH